MLFRSKANLDASTARKYLRHLNEVCAFADNVVIAKMKAKRVVRFPKMTQKSVWAHSGRTIAELLAACDRLDNDWWAWTARAMR